VTPVARLLIPLAIVLHPALAASAPPCAKQCAELAKRGDLAPGVTPAMCSQRVCQEAARKFYEKNEFDVAIEALDYIREERKGAPAYEFDRGVVLYALGRYEEAIESFDVVIAEYPDGIRGGAQRAHALERLGRLDESRKEFERLLNSPASEGEFKDLKTRSYLKANIGVIKLRKGDLAGGKADLAEALEIDGRNKHAETFRTRVVPYLESGALEPEGLERLIAAFEEMALGRLVPASAHFQELIERWPGYTPAYLLLAEGWRASRRYAGCEDLLRTAEKHAPDDLELRVHRIRCSLLRHGVASEAARPAVAELEQIVAEHPDNTLAVKLLAATK
jgi:tetratricopeptide (TPR) repeat protein